MTFLKKYRPDIPLQLKELKKSKKAYKKGKYHVRKKIPGYRKRTSSWVVKAKKRWGISSITPASLARVTGCPKKDLQAIVRKGKGAYYSSGSRPSQTPHSWGRARLASAVMGGPAARIDRKLLYRCRHITR